IMGDGRVAMILDVTGIATYAKLQFADVQAEENHRKNMVEQSTTAHDETRMDVLMFNNAANEIFAVPLASVLRLEKFEADQIERIGNKEFLTYRGRGLPLVRIENHLPVRPAPDDTSEKYMIIPRKGDGIAGIMVSKILDSQQVSVNLEPALGNCKGVMGSAVVGDHLTVFINPDEILDAANIDIREFQSSPA
nr:chemotaxis protein CheW [Vampirovibrio sp.]